MPKVLTGFMVDNHLAVELVVEIDRLWIGVFWFSRERETGDKKDQKKSVAHRVTPSGCAINRTFRSSDAACRPKVGAMQLIDIHRRGNDNHSRGREFQISNSKRIRKLEKVRITIVYCRRCRPPTMD
jgi:hypothetical protein